MKYIILLVLLSSLSITGFATDKPDAKALPSESSTPAKLESVRLRFVPGSAPRKGEEWMADKGAAWSALGPIPGTTNGVLWLQATAGIGDKFPVQNKAGVTLFEVLVVKGDDSHLVLEVRSEESSQRFDIARDKAETVKVAGTKYELEYPSVFVGAHKNEKLTTPKAIVNVLRLR